VAETIGLISDTHGLMRQEAIEALRGCDRIVHAGDVGSADVLEELRRLAPVIAVKGNVDHGAWALALPMSAVVDLDGHKIYVLHILSDLELMPAPPDIRAVVYGHSHKPSIEERGGVLYVNPGSAGPKRFRLPITVARLTVVRGRLSARTTVLEVG
jgi:putative phosphoesterase